jgi:hypothetical protein
MSYTPAAEFSNASNKGMSYLRSLPHVYNPSALKIVLQSVSKVRAQQHKSPFAWKKLHALLVGAQYREPL